MPEAGHARQKHRSCVGALWYRGAVDPVRVASRQTTYATGRPVIMGPPFLLNSAKLRESDFKKSAALAAADDRLKDAVSHAGLGPAVSVGCTSAFEHVRTQVRHRIKSEKCQREKSRRSPVCAQHRTRVCSDIIKRTHNGRPTNKRELNQWCKARAVTRGL
jgi:hypothetical protein